MWTSPALLHDMRVHPWSFWHHRPSIQPLISTITTAITSDTEQSGQNGTSCLWSSPALLHDMGVHPQSFWYHCPSIQPSNSTTTPPSTSQSVNQNNTAQINIQQAKENIRRSGHDPDKSTYIVDCDASIKKSSLKSQLKKRNVVCFSIKSDRNSR